MIQSERFARRPTELLPRLEPLAAFRQEVLEVFSELLVPNLPTSDFPPRNLEPIVRLQPRHLSSKFLVEVTWLSSKSILKTEP